MVGRTVEPPRVGADKYSRPHFSALGAGTYRIRSDIITVLNGRGEPTGHMFEGFLADRKVKILFFSVWWCVSPCWRRSEAEAEVDISNDRMRRSYKNEPRIIGPWDDPMRPSSSLRNQGERLQDGKEGSS